MSMFTGKQAKEACAYLQKLLPNMDVRYSLSSYDRGLGLGVLRKDGTFLSDIKFGWIDRTSEFTGRQGPKLSNTALASFARAIKQSEAYFKEEAPHTPMKLPG